MTELKEFEELQSKKTKLEGESRSLEDKQKTLDERLKILEEKLAIKELEVKNQRMRDAVKDLESKVNELEGRLKSPPGKPDTFKPPEEPKTKPVGMIQDESKKIAEHKPDVHTEGGVVITAIGDSDAHAVEQKVGQPEKDQAKQPEKKKRKFF